MEYMDYVEAEVAYFYEDDTVAPVDAAEVPFKVWLAAEIERDYANLAAWSDVEAALEEYRAWAARAGVVPKIAMSWVPWDIDVGHLVAVPVVVDGETHTVRQVALEYDNAEGFALLHGIPFWGIYNCKHDHVSWLRSMPKEARRAQLEGTRAWTSEELQAYARW